MLIAKITFFVILILYCVVLAQEPEPDIEITRFSLNPSYGIQKTVESTTLEATKYLLLKFENDFPDEDEFIVIDSIMSNSKPQLCDSNAVSFIIKHKADSAMLLVMELGSVATLDTIITYPDENMALKGRWDSGQRRLYSLNRYLFYSPDSLLFWLIPYPGRSIMEIGRIQIDGSYLTVKHGQLRKLPQFTPDFSMALYCNQLYLGYGSISDALTQIMAYDFKADSIYEIAMVKGHCNSPQFPQMSNKLYCLCLGLPDNTNLCVVEDSIPRSLFSVEYPVSISGYDLYHDSIVIKTANCCDKDYGIKTQMIPR